MFDDLARAIDECPEAGAALVRIKDAFGDLLAALRSHGGGTAADLERLIRLFERSAKLL